MKTNIKDMLTLFGKLYPFLPDIKKEDDVDIEVYIRDIVNNLQETPKLYVEIVSFMAKREIDELIKTFSSAEILEIFIKTFAENEFIGLHKKFVALGWFGND